ncbi:Periplasmic binding protein [hydrothermal vent metagenome]|uniref:Periplasmic binding protein n=1 Tax=hydrothermal vent metagenome TaxID=652676 RepID=A0A1W1BXX4_9ZZZZ
MENIIATNPDIVIILAPLMREQKLNQKDLITPWQRLPITASKTNSIYIVDKSYAGIPSDRLVCFLKDFREFLNDYKINSGHR